MPERFMDKLCRKWFEFKKAALQSVFKRAIEQYDKLCGGAFLAFSWGVDEITDYHVIAERSYPECHIYGTKVSLYDGPREEEQP